MLSCVNVMYLQMICRGGMHASAQLEVKGHLYEPIHLAPLCDSWASDIGHLYPLRHLDIPKNIMFQREHSGSPMCLFLSRATKYDTVHTQFLFLCSNISHTILASDQIFACFILMSFQFFMDIYFCKIV